MPEGVQGDAARRKTAARAIRNPFFNLCVFGRLAKIALGGQVRTPEAPSENEVFSRRLVGECGLYLATFFQEFGRALTEGSAGDGSAKAPGREESFGRPRVVAYAPRGARFPFGFGSPPFAPGAMKRDA
jgi:hypothetical protein